MISTFEIHKPQHYDHCVFIAKKIFEVVPVEKLAHSENWASHPIKFFQINMWEVRKPQNYCYFFICASAGLVDSIMLRVYVHNETYFFFICSN